MNVQVYQWEHFDRGQRRYIVFATCFAVCIILSILTRNFIGAILLFFLLGGYLYFMLRDQQTMQIMLSEQWLTIRGKLHNRPMVKGYTLEVDPKDHHLKNIVFFFSNHHGIYTFNDDPDQIQNFVHELGQYTQVIGEYQQSFFEKLARVMKI